MSILEQIKIGTSTFFDAIPFIFKHKLGWFFIFPILFNIVLFFGGWAAVGELTNISTDYTSSVIPIPDFLSGFVEVLIWLIIKISFFLIFAYLGGFIVLILLSPVLAIISEKVEEKITGNTYPFNIQQLIKDVLRGVIIALRNMIIEVGFLILLFFMSFIPVVGFATPFIMFFISAYFYGFSFIDYSSERNKMNIKSSIAFVRNNKGIATANGALFSLFMLIPYFGIMFAGFAAIISTVGATLAVNKINNKTMIQPL